VVTLRWAFACAWIVACGGSQRDAAKPGDDHDEGAGLLAQASTSLVSGKAGSDDVAANPKRRRTVSA
jgi:hypothetical protein